LFVVVTVNGNPIGSCSRITKKNRPAGIHPRQPEHQLEKGGKPSSLFYSRKRIGFTTFTDAESKPKMKLKISAVVLFAVVIVLGFAASAGAVDGTIEIN
jgi:hypothetical protein